MSDNLTSTITLWLIRETEKARLYYTKPPEQNPTEKDKIWIPKSLITHQFKYGCKEGEIPRCDVTIEEWFLNKNNL